MLKFGSNEGLSFEDEEVPSVLGFKGREDASHHIFIHIGYKSENAGNSSNRHSGDFPVDITCGSQLMFVYIDIIEHQNVGDVRAPIIKIIDSERRLRNGSISTGSPIHHKSYINLEKGYLKWRHTTAIRHLIQCSIFRTLQTKRQRLLGLLL